MTKCQLTEGCGCKDGLIIEDIVDMLCFSCALSQSIDE